MLLAKRMVRPRSIANQVSKKWPLKSTGMIPLDQRLLMVNRPFRSFKGDILAFFAAGKGERPCRIASLVRIDQLYLSVP